MGRLLVAEATSPWEEEWRIAKEPESVIDSGSRLPLQARVLGL